MSKSEKSPFWLKIRWEDRLIFLYNAATRQVFPNMVRSTLRGGQICNSWCPKIVYDTDLFESTFRVVDVGLWSRRPPHPKFTYRAFRISKFRFNLRIVNGEHPPEQVPKMTSYTTFFDETLIFFEVFRDDTRMLPRCQECIKIAFWLCLMQF